MPLDKTILFPLVLIVVVFATLGFIQIVFQTDMKKTLEQSEDNFNKMVQTQAIMNRTLDVISHSQPQSNFTAQAEAINDIEYLKDAVDDIRTLLNNTR